MPNNRFNYSWFKSQITMYFIIIFLLLKINLIKCELNEEVDLTWSFDSSTIYWTGHQPFAFSKQTAELREDGSW